MPWHSLIVKASAAFVTLVVIWDRRVSGCGGGAEDRVLWLGRAVQVLTLAARMLILYDCYRVLALLEEGDIVLHQAQELVHILDLLLTFDVHLQAANIVLLQASAVAASSSSCEQAHANTICVVRVLLGMVALTAQHLACLPLLDLVIRGQIQLRNRLGLADGLAHARLGADLPDAREQVYHFVVLFLLNRGHDIDLLLVIGLMRAAATHDRVSLVCRGGLELVYLYGRIIGLRRLWLVRLLA